jgi:hypothetical protein
MSHHRLAALVVLAALILDTVCGAVFSVAQQIPLWHGLFCALANAVTVGGNVPPSTPLGYAVTAVECALVVPLFAATFSLFTSGLTAVHVHQARDEIKDHIAAHLTGVAAMPPSRRGRHS